MSDIKSSSTEELSNALLLNLIDDNSDIKVRVELHESQIKTLLNKVKTLEASKMDTPKLFVLISDNFWKALAVLVATGIVTASTGLLTKIKNFFQ